VTNGWIRSDTKVNAFIRSSQRTCNKHYVRLENVLEMAIVTVTIENQQYLRVTTSTSACVLELVAVLLYLYIFIYIYIIGYFEWGSGFSRNMKRHFFQFVGKLVLQISCCLTHTHTGIELKICERFVVCAAFAASPRVFVCMCV